MTALAPVIRINKPVLKKTIRMHIKYFVHVYICGLPLELTISRDLLPY